MLYPAQVINPSSTAFTEAQNSYWNVLQRQKIPTCFFQPTDVRQVQTAVAQVAKAKCPFAIKGGGHSSNSEGSSIENGFLFDLAKLNHVEIASDNQTVRVGPGVRWGPLFKILEKRGVIAVGGRDFGVGVPGFIFGGKSPSLVPWIQRAMQLMCIHCRGHLLLCEPVRLGNRQLGVR